MTPDVTRFLTAHGWGNATAIPLAADASARRYLRLSDGARQAVLMCAPPEDRQAFDAFCDVAGQLRALGLSAPAIYAADPEAGLMLLEDLGTRPFADLTKDLSEATGALVEVLVMLDRVGPAWDLPRFTADGMAEMTRLALPDSLATETALAAMTTAFTPLFDRPLAPALRDVHVENLMWLPDRKGAARVGLLDFQDAVLAPTGYDLVSYIKDARRDVPADLASAATEGFATALGLDPAFFARDCALLSFQRNLRIMGVFRRLAATRGKPGYLAFLPRVWTHVTEALAHPDLSDLRTAMQPLLPEVAP